MLSNVNCTRPIPGQVLQVVLFPDNETWMIFKNAFFKLFLKLELNRF